MPAGDFDELEDPLERLERNEKQGLQAFRYVLISVAAIILAGIAVVVIDRAGGVGCTEGRAGGGGEACSMDGRPELVIVPTLLAFALSVNAMRLTYQRWREHVRWRPWLFATYGMWLVTTACLLFTSTVAFVEVG